MSDVAEFYLYRRCSVKFMIRQMLATSFHCLRPDTSMCDGGGPEARSHEAS